MSKQFIRRLRGGAALLMILLIGQAGWAEESSRRSELANRVLQRTLSNGLTVLLVERHQAPVVSINVTFRVGGLDEQTGHTGVAHLYEHMAFKGTTTVGTKDYTQEQPLLEELDRLHDSIKQERDRLASEGKKRSTRLEELQRQFQDTQARAAHWVVGNELSLLYQRHGAVGLNASTGKDITRYTVSLPANRLPLWAAVESDRMSNPVFREFYKERAVVMEERRSRTEDSPSGLLYETFMAAAFQAHPYGLPTIGWASDIQALTPAITKEFFNTHYSPANAVIAMVGEIDPPAVFQLIEETFGRIPAGPPPPKVITVEPPQRGERRVEVEFNAEPRLYLGYHKPAIHHPDDFVFDVIDALLSDGVTSRLYRRVVRDQRLAASIGTRSGVPGVRGPNLFFISAVPVAPHTTAEVEQAIYRELARLQHEPVTDRELEKVLNNLDASLIRSLRSNSGLASQLAYFQTLAGDWRYILEARSHIAAVTTEDVQRVAKQYFSKANRTVATLVKSEPITDKAK